MFPGDEAVQQALQRVRAQPGRNATAAKVTWIPEFPDRVAVMVFGPRATRSSASLRACSSGRYPPRARCCASVRLIRSARRAWRRWTPPLVAVDAESHEVEFDVRSFEIEICRHIIHLVIIVSGAQGQSNSVRLAGEARRNRSRAFFIERTTMSHVAISRTMICDAGEASPSEPDGDL